MKFDFTKRTRSVVARRHEPEGIRALSNLYWYALLASFLLIVIAILVYGTLGLLRILDDLNGTPNAFAPPPPALNRATLDTVLQSFDARRSQFDLLKTNRGRVISDPSR